MSFKNEIGHNSSSRKDFCKRFAFCNPDNGRISFSQKAHFQKKKMLQGPFRVRWLMCLPSVIRLKNEHSALFFLLL